MTYYRRLMKLAVIGFTILIVALLAVSYSSSGQASQKSVVIINLNEQIDPGSAHMFTSALKNVNPTDVKAVVIDMNTPGGLLSDMQTIVSAIQQVQDKGVPVYTYIEPNGWGASAGSYLAVASNITYMGPGSFIGPSTPIVVGGTSVEQAHVQNAMEQYMTSLALRNNHNSTAAAIMVKDNTAYGYQQATAIGLVNGISHNLSTFMSTVNLSGFNTYNINPSSYDQFLSLLSNSVVDSILILFGTIAILVDLSHSTLLLSVAGITLIGLGFVGLEIISATLIGLVLLMIGVFLVLIEFKTGHGVALFSGIGVGLLGAFLMSPDYIASNSYNPSSPFNSTNIIIAVVIVIIAGFTAYYLRYIFSAMVRRVETGIEGMTGKVAICKSDLTPKGVVAYEGQHWRARMIDDQTAKLGDKVIIKGSEGLLLIVDKIHTKDEEH